MKTRIVAITDVGKERTNNEDAFAVCSDLISRNWGENPVCSQFGSLGSLAIVADGMGGVEAGEMASEIAIKSTQEYISSKVSSIKEIGAAEVEGILREAISKGNKDILDHVLSDPDTIGMGTTIVILWIVNNLAHIFWVGDSRCYMYNRKKGLVRLTKDHSYVQELLDKGEIKPQDTFNHPASGVITRGLGDIDTITEPDVLSVSYKPGDVFLLCSDGLCGYCDDTKIERVMHRNSGNLELCCHDLMEMALDAGGEDNITVALIEIIPEGQDVCQTSVYRKALNFLGLSKK